MHSGESFDASGSSGPGDVTEGCHASQSRRRSPGERDDCGWTDNALLGLGPHHLSEFLWLVVSRG
jgi:hypothetical protein